MKNILNYWKNPFHRNYIEHYFGGRYQSTFLAFDKVWQEQYLPKDRQPDELICNLLDTESNIVYKTIIHHAYEQSNYILNTDYESVLCYSLMSYFYEEHHCPCHRHTDACRAGLEESDEDFECQGRRFKIKSITPKDSDLILMSETMTQEDLEEMLLASYFNFDNPLFSAILSNQHDWDSYLVFADYLEENNLVEKADAFRWAGKEKKMLVEIINHLEEKS